MRVLTPTRFNVPPVRVSMLSRLLGPALVAGLLWGGVASNTVAADSRLPVARRSVPTDGLRALLLQEFRLIEARLDEATAESLGRQLREAGSLQELSLVAVNLALAASAAEPAPPTTLLPPPSGGELGVAVLRGPTGRIMGSAPKAQRSSVPGGRGTRNLSRGTWLPSPDSQ